MHAHVKVPLRTIVPTLRYRDVATAIDWLCNAFGFDRHLVVPGDDGAIRYAELTFGDGMIMLGPVENSAFKALMTQPEDAGGAETQICYLFVEDAAAHCARAKAAGATIVLGIEEMGGRGYSCRDPEGHIWNFGTYNPWKRQSARGDMGDRPQRRSGALARGVRRAALVSGLLVIVAASAVLVEWVSGANGWSQRALEPQVAEGDPADAAMNAAREQLARAREGRDAAERAVKDFRQQLAQERSAREAAERAAKEVQAHLAQERSAKEAAERGVREARELLAKVGTEQAVKEVREMREQLAREHSALETAQRIAEETREQLSLTERAAEAVREQLVAERSAREAVERAGKDSQEEEEKARAAKEETERAKQQAREQSAKERAKEEREERAAKEARERRERAARRPAPRRRVSEEPQPSKAPAINWLGG